MNVDLILIGLISLLLGLIAQLFDKKRSAREKRDVPLGYTGAEFKYAKWTLIGIGAFAIIYGLLNSG